MLSFTQVTTETPSTGNLPTLLVSLGMTPTGSPTPPHVLSILSVILDGRVVGQMAEDLMKDVAKKIRTLKAIGDPKVLSWSILEVMRLVMST